ncbi:Hypothetical predicted protein, partial [Pelobates cultripes]
MLPGQKSTISEELYHYGESQTAAKCSHAPGEDTPANRKPGSVTCIFKEYADRVSDHGESNMVPAAAHTDSDPPSPTASESSMNSTHIDIKEILRNLSSRSGLAQMLGKLETTFQHKMEGLSSEIKQ